MLYIHVKGFPSNCIKNVNGKFNLFKKKDWFNNEHIREYIKDIDNTIVIKDEYLESPVFGGMSPERLSTGCKAVILMEVLQNSNVYATHCGDNCVNSILDIASRKDINITLHHPMSFPDDGFEAYMVDTGRIVRNGGEFINEFYKIVG